MKKSNYELELLKYEEVKNGLNFPVIALTDDENNIANYTWKINSFCKHHNQEILKKHKIPIFVYDYFCSFMDYFVNKFEIIYFILNVKDVSIPFFKSFDYDVGDYQLSVFLKKRFDNVLETFNSLPFTYTSEQKIEFLQETLYKGFDISWDNYIYERISDMTCELERHMFGEKQNHIDFHNYPEVFNKDDLIKLYYPLCFEYLKSNISFDELGEKITDRLKNYLTKNK